MRGHFRQGAWLMLGMLTLAGPATSAAQEGDFDSLLTRLSQFHQHQQALGSFAEERSESSEISELAEEIAVDHHILEEWLREAGHAYEGGDSGSPRFEDDAGEAGEGFEELEAREGAEFDALFLDYQQEIHRQAIDYLQENRPESFEESEQANHLKVTHETLRKHLAMLQQQGQGGEQGEAD